MVQAMRCAPLIFVFTLSCGTDASSPGSVDGGSGSLIERSGRRLKRETWVGSDGTVSYTIGYFDTQLGIVCGFRQYRGGWYCMPDNDLTPADPSKYVSADIRRE